eukprot:3021510-Prorocentrum_lima.AAC.1
MAADTHLEHITYDGGRWRSLNEKMDDAFPDDKIQRMPVGSRPAGWDDTPFVVHLSHMKARLT